jgi:hypothetical protein
MNQPFTNLDPSALLLLKIPELLELSKKAKRIRSTELGQFVAAHRFRSCPDAPTEASVPKGLGSNRASGQRGDAGTNALETSTVIPADNVDKYGLRVPVEGTAAVGVEKRPTDFGRIHVTQSDQCFGQWGGILSLKSQTAGTVPFHKNEAILELARAAPLEF